MRTVRLPRTGRRRGPLRSGGYRHRRSGFRLVEPEYGDDGPIGNSVISAHYVQHCGGDYIQPGGSSGQNPAGTCKSVDGAGARLDDTFNKLERRREPEPPVPPPPPPPEGKEQPGELSSPAPVSRSAGPSRPRACRTPRQVGASAGRDRERLPSDPGCIGRQPVQLWKRKPGKTWGACLADAARTAGVRPRDSGDPERGIPDDRGRQLDCVRWCYFVAGARALEAGRGAVASRSEPATGSRLSLRGKVVPSLPARRRPIERRAGRRWRRVGFAKLNRRPRYRLPSTAGWRGKRADSRRWLGNRTYGPAVSAPVTVTVRAR